MRDCACGKSVRLGAAKIRMGRKPGVYHYIAHADGSADCTELASEKWECIALKPYPVREADKEYVKLIGRWDAARTQEGKA